MKVFLERIWRRVQRKSKGTSSEKLETSKQMASSSRGRLTPAKGTVSVVLQGASVSYSPEVARGDFLDSTCPTAMAAAATSLRLCSTSRLDDSHDITSAPSLRVDFPMEISRTSEVGTISTSHQECNESHTSATTTVMVEEKLMLSATDSDSGLYSEEEDSSEEYLEVFSDEEDEDDEWLISADEVSLDTVMAATGGETVYR